MKLDWGQTPSLVERALDVRRRVGSGTRLAAALQESKMSLPQYLYAASLLDGTFPATERVRSFVFSKRDIKS